MLLGRFLEISVAVDDILASIAFYEALGFVQTMAAECWPHPYAVLTDGRLFIGLHQTRRHPIVLTYVQPDLPCHVARLQAVGLTSETAQLSQETFNHVSLIGPGGQRIVVVEARTFSPPSVDTLQESACGYFTEFGIPVRTLAEASAFWETLGFVALEETLVPFTRRSLTSDRLNLGLYQTRALRQPVLTFEDPQMEQRLELLRQRGFSLTDEMPDALDATTNAVLTAPEGTRLLLLTSPGDVENLFVPE